MAAPFDHPYEPDRVRCVACGTVYEKPLSANGGASPDCPRCGYIGWISVRIPVPSDQRRTDAQVR